MENQNEKLRNVCNDTAMFFEKLGEPEYHEIKGKLDWVVGSYDYDKNPIGLYEIGEMALDILKDLKKKSPKKVTKKIIDDLEKVLKK
jgi:hypothetical protein